MDAPSSLLSLHGSIPHFEDLPRFEDKKNLWWTAKYVQAWVHDFHTASLLGILELDRTVFGVNPRGDLLFRALRYEESWLAQGTESSKPLGLVRGSTRKPFAQKGRGKARVGTLRAAMFRGGYTVHGPRPHDKSIDIPQKIYASAIRSALSSKFAQDQVVVVNSLSLQPHDDKVDMKKYLDGLDLTGKRICMLYGNDEPNKALVDVVDKFVRKKALGDMKAEYPILLANAREIAVAPVMDSEVLVLDKEAIEVLEEMYRVE